MEASVRTIGQPTREREVGAALLLIMGAAGVALMAVTGQPPYRDLLVLGAVAVAAWLVDGTSRRYMGPGLIAFAAGLGITLGKDVGISSFEHSLVYGGFGVALIIISFFNPAMVRASGAFLLYTAVTVGFSAWVFSGFPLGWELAVILAVWGTVELVRIRREAAVPSGTQPERGSPTTPPGETEESAPRVHAYHS